MKNKTLRPKDAATLILYKIDGDELRVLLGQRHKGHIFMPNAYVFPGGRVNSVDSRVRPSSSLKADVLEKLERAANPARARAIAVAAIRETYEETGLLIARNINKEKIWHMNIGPKLAEHLPKLSQNN